MATWGQACTTYWAQQKSKGQQTKRLKHIFFLPFFPWNSGGVGEGVWPHHGGSQNGLQTWRPVGNGQIRSFVSQHCPQIFLNINCCTKEGKFTFRRLPPSPRPLYLIFVFIWWLEDSYICHLCQPDPFSNRGVPRIHCLAKSRAEKGQANAPIGVTSN